MKWSEADFERMTWHDNHVHGLSISSGEHGAGDFALDLDYILEWIKGEDGQVRFRIAPARLCFHDVIWLRISIDYATPTAALGPFSIGVIERRIESRQGYEATCWTIHLNWPPGDITFEAPGFTQELTGREVIVDEQVLTAEERSNATTLLR